jgi:cytochrome b561
VPPDARHLPPRRSLPRDVVVPALPGLGHSWYDRGPGYWARRAGMSLMWLLLVLLVVAFDVGLFSGIRNSSRAGFAVAVGVDAALALAVIGFVVVRTARRWRLPQPPRQMRDPGARGRPRAGRGALARLVYPAGVLLAAVVMLVCPGLFIALFLTSLLPATPAERQARLWLAEQLHRRGLLPAA